MDSWNSRPAALASCMLWVALSGCGGGDASEEPAAPSAAAQTLPHSYQLQASERALDLGIDGDGLFVLQPARGADRTYSRLGKLDLDRDGYLVHADGGRVLGVASDPAQDAATLRVTALSMKAQATRRVTQVLNLDSRTAMHDATSAFDADDPVTYDAATGVGIWFGDGSRHALTLYFRHAPTSDPQCGGWSCWLVWPTVDDLLARTAHVLRFNPDGASLQASGHILRLAAGVAGLPHAVEIDFTGSTEFGAPFAATDLGADGYGRGTLGFVEIEADGRLALRYDNGQSTAGGQLLLARVSVVDRLQRTGTSSWTCGPECRAPSMGTPGSALLGRIRARALNVVF